ncbi:MAG: hypothetical protein AN488_07365 [Anabaena sp. WA113]|jgi:hypothetical protein|nr:MAG: hypothetical protein AN488_07365 [Anabaena sp. WA113]OBQ27816.1 MAG: hypothetical protein AN483_18840 [Aphanizomenon flos-aquae MDT14a]
MTSYYALFVQSYLQTVDKNNFPYIQASVENKLRLDDFIFDKTSPYQTTKLYKEAFNNFLLGGYGADLAMNQIIQLTEEFRNDRWKICYEFGSWCVNTYKDDPHPFHEEKGIDFICKSLIYVMAKDSPIQFTKEEKDYVLMRLMLPIHKMSPIMAEKITIKIMEIGRGLEEFMNVTRLIN